MKNKSHLIRHIAIAAVILLSAIFLTEAKAQVILGGPSVGLTYREEGNLPFLHTVNLGRHYKFVFSGAEAQADSDGVPGTFAYDGFMWNKKKPENNGHGNNVDGVDSSNKGKSKEGLDSDPTVDDEINTAVKVPGWWDFKTRVNSYEISGLYYSSAALHKLSDVIRIMFTTPVILREQNITLMWMGEGNSQDADGHLHILGSATIEPPVPIGAISLNQTLYANGEKPPFTWAIVRE